MVINMLQLPNELLCDKILWTLCLRDKAIVSAVCRSLNALLTPIIYNDINIVISRDRWDLTQIKALANTIRHAGPVTKYIERLKVCTDFTPLDFEDGLCVADPGPKRPYPEPNNLFQYIEAAFHLPNIRVINVALPDPEDYSLAKVKGHLPLATQLQSLTLRYCEARDKVLEQILKATPNLKKLRYETWRFDLEEPPRSYRPHPEPNFSMEHFERAIEHVKGSLEWLDISMLIYTTDYGDSWEYHRDLGIDGHIPNLKGFTQLKYLESPIILLFGHRYYTYPEATLRALLPSNLTHLCLRDDVCTIFQVADSWLADFQTVPEKARPIEYKAMPKSSKYSGPLMLRLLDLQCRQGFAPHLSKVTIKANGEIEIGLGWGESVLDEISRFLDEEGIEFQLLMRPLRDVEFEAYRKTDYYSLRLEYEELT